MITHARFESRGEILLFHDVVGGEHATMFGPHGQKLVFRGDASVFDNAKCQFAWAFEGVVQVGDRFVFATADREVAGLFLATSVQLSLASGVVRGDGGKPLYLIPGSTEAVLAAVRERADQGPPQGAADARPTREGALIGPPSATARRV